METERQLWLTDFGPYDSVPDVELRGVLERLDVKLNEGKAEGKDTYSSREVLDLVADFVGLEIPRLYRVYDRVRVYQTTPMDRKANPERGRYSFSPDGIRAFTALLFNVDRRLGFDVGQSIEWQGIEAATRETLGDHYLAGMIRDPNSQ